MLGRNIQRGEIVDRRSRCPGLRRRRSPDRRRSRRISSITWLIGMDAAALGGTRRTGSVTSAVSVASRASSAASSSSALRAASASVTRFFSAVDGRPKRLALVRRHRAQRLHQLGDASPSCRARRRAPPRSRLVGGAGDVGQQRRFRAREVWTLSYTASIHASSSVVDAQPRAWLRRSRSPRQPCQRGTFPTNGRGHAFGESASLEPRRFQKHSAWCSSVIRAHLGACSTSAANAGGSWMARSDRTLRSISMPALLRPSMKRP